MEYPWLKYIKVIQNGSLIQYCIRHIHMENNIYGTYISIWCSTNIDLYHV